MRIAEVGSARGPTGHRRRFHLTGGVAGPLKTPVYFGVRVKVADKSNEITALPHLLRVLELAGCLVTIDAMGCQKAIAKEIIEADADYVLALKGNQETVHAEVESYLDDALVQQAAPASPGKEKP